MTPEEPTTCDACWALVPRAFMTFHRDWHADLERDREAAVADVPALVAIDGRRRSA